MFPVIENESPATMGIGHDFQPELSNIGDMIRLYELGEYNEMEVSNQGG